MNKVMLAALLAVFSYPVFSYPNPSVIEQNRANQVRLSDLSYKTYLDELKCEINDQLSKATGPVEVDIYFDIRGSDLKQIIEDLARDGWEANLVHCEAPDYNLLYIKVLEV